MNTTLIKPTTISHCLRNTAFEKAVEILSRDTTSGRPAVAASNIGRAPSAGEPLVAKIARKLDLPADSIAEVYAESGEGGLDIVTGVGKLDSSTAGATKQLALLALRGFESLGKPTLLPGSLRRGSETYGNRNHVSTLGRLILTGLLGLIFPYILE